MRNFGQAMAVSAVPLLTALFQRHLVLLAISSLLHAENRLPDSFILIDYFEFDILTRVDRGREEGGLQIPLLLCFFANNSPTENPTPLQHCDN